MSKSSIDSDISDQENDDYIEKIMGPTPEEAPPTSKRSEPVRSRTVEALKASIYPEAAKDPDEAGESSVRSAAEEANAVIKSWDPNLGSAEIEKVDDGVEALPNLVSADSDEADEEVADTTEESSADTEAEPFGTTAPEMDGEDTDVDAEGASNNGSEPATEAMPAKPSSKPTDEDESTVDDPLTERAVEEIVAAEADTVLEAEDAKKASEEDPLRFSKKHEKKPHLLGQLWGTRTGKAVIFGGIAATILFLTLLPTTRYLALNTAGVRASLSLTVLDDVTEQPLKNVQVSAAGISGQTDSSGHITLDNVRLGKTKLLIEKRAFADLSRDITLGWGSNPLGSFDVKAVGTQYTFTATDFLSGKPITNAEVSSGDGNAHADKDGKIILTLDTASKNDADQITVTISADKYRDETINLTVNNKEAQAVKMVPARKHVFISKRSGKYDVYTVDVDGKNEKKIVSGTGLERDDISLIPHQNDNITALVATRENVRDSTGYLLSTLYLLDTSTGDLVKIDQSEQIQVVGWSNDEHLIYVKVAAGSSGANPKRHRLVSFNAKNVSDIKELASSNSFNDVLMMGDKVFYAPSNTFQDNPDASLYEVNPDGSNQKTILSKEVFNIFRTDYDTLMLSADASSWYTYKISSATATSIQPPSNPANRLYTDNSNNSDSLWADTRDGKAMLLDYDITKKADVTLVTKAGVKEPVYWLSTNYVIFRVNDGRETADYIINTDGGEARKIADVTDTSGIDRWFYY